MSAWHIFHKPLFLRGSAYKRTLDYPIRTGTLCTTQIPFSTSSIKCYRIRKNGACCYYYSAGHLRRLLKWASSKLLKAFSLGAVTTSAGRSFHMFTTLWLNVNLRRSSLDHSYFIFRECPRSLEVSAIRSKLRQWTPFRNPWRIIFTSAMPP